MIDDFYTRPTALYRLYGAANELLYVGIAHDLTTRWRDHSKSKSWWGTVARKEITWHDDRPSAELAEQQAIMVEGPRMNRIMPPWRVDAFTHKYSQGRRDHERATAAVFAALDEGGDLEEVAREAGWHPRYIANLAANPRSRWFRKRFAQGLPEEWEPTKTEVKA